MDITGALVQVQGVVQNNFVAGGGREMSCEGKTRSLISTSVCRTCKPHLRRC